MIDEVSPAPETDAVGTETIVKDALAVRLKAFFSMDNTRIYRERRFAFLAAAGAATLIAAIALPKNNVKPVIEVAEVTEPQIDLSRHDIALEEDHTPHQLKRLQYARVIVLDHSCKKMASAEARPIKSRKLSRPFINRAIFVSGMNLIYISMTRH